MEGDKIKDNKIMKKTGILVKPNNNEFLCILNNMDSFIKCCKNLDDNSNSKLTKNTRLELYKCALNIIEILDEKINDIGLHEVCSVDIVENYDGKGMILISIFGDDGVVEFGIITNPTEFD